MPHSIIRSTTTSRSLSMVVDTSLDSKPLIAPTSTKAVPPGTRDKGSVRRGAGPAVEGQHHVCGVGAIRVGQRQPRREERARGALGEVAPERGGLSGRRHSQRRRRPGRQSSARDVVVIAGVREQRACRDEMKRIVSRAPGRFPFFPTIQALTRAGATSEPPDSLGCRRISSREQAEQGRGIVCRYNDDRAWEGGDPGVAGLRSRRVLRDDRRRQRVRARRPDHAARRCGRRRSRRPAARVCRRC